MKIPEARYVLSDLDNTLTTREKVFSAATQAGLREFWGSQVVFAACTGRSFARAQALLQHFDPECVHVVSGGAELVRANGEVLWHQRLPAEAVEQIVEVFVTHQTVCILGKGSVLYAPDAFFAQVQRKYGVGETKVPVAPLSELADWSGGLITSAYTTDTVIEAIAAIPELEVVVVEDPKKGKYLDITRQGVNKATGAQRWCEEYGISLDQVVAFGDSANDLPLARVVGRFLAVANAAPSVRALAQEVIGDAQDDAVVQYARRWLPAAR